MRKTEPDIANIITLELNAYKETFRMLVHQYAKFSTENGDSYCDFFVDISSMMNGGWDLTAYVEHCSIDQFKFFDWYEVLKLDDPYIPEDDLRFQLKIAYKIGYLWIVNELSQLDKEINHINLRLFHNGSNFEEALNAL